MKRTRRVVVFGPSVRSAGRHRLGSLLEPCQVGLERATATWTLDVRDRWRVTAIASKELRVLKTQFASLCHRGGFSSRDGVVLQQTGITRRWSRLRHPT
jgi:hypothetical protein